MKVVLKCEELLLLNCSPRCQDWIRGAWHQGREEIGNGLTLWQLRAKERSPPCRVNDDSNKSH